VRTQAGAGVEKAACEDTPKGHNMRTFMNLLQENTTQNNLQKKTAGKRL
jgi:hypothetical protein